MKTIKAFTWNTQNGNYTRIEVFVDNKETAAMSSKDLPKLVSFLQKHPDASPADATTAELINTINK